MTPKHLAFFFFFFCQLIFSLERGSARTLGLGVCTFRFRHLGKGRSKEECKDLSHTASPLAKESLLFPPLALGRFLCPRRPAIGLSDNRKVQGRAGSQGHRGPHRGLHPLDWTHALGLGEGSSSSRHCKGAVSPHPTPPRVPLRCEPFQQSLEMMLGCRWRGGRSRSVLCVVPVPGTGHPQARGCSAGACSEVWPACWPPPGLCIWEH